MSKVVCLFLLILKCIPYDNFFCISCSLDKCHSDRTRQKACLKEWDLWFDRIPTSEDKGHVQIWKWKMPREQPPREERTDFRDMSGDDLLPFEHFFSPMCNRNYTKKQRDDAMQGILQESKVLFYNYIYFLHPLFMYYLMSHRTVLIASDSQRWKRASMF